jgi:PIN domain nuclease of toxin-antitoxin system
VSLLLDTQLVVWAALVPERLGPDTLDMLEDSELLLSAVSAWELAIKQGQGKLDLRVPVRQFFRSALRELAATELSVVAEHAAAVETLPAIHRDPFDRLLVVQAEQQGAQLLTADRTLPAYGSFVRLV